MRRLAWAALLAGLVGNAPQVQAQSAAYEELMRFSEVLTHIRNNYADSVTQQDLLRAAIEGVLRSLDPHSVFKSKEAYDRTNALERGELAVTGIQLELAEGIPIVLNLARNSPAERAGILPGDRVLSVSGQSVVGLPAHAIRLLLAGKKDTRIAVAVERGSRLDPDSVSVILKLEMAKQGSFILDSRMADRATGYVRLEEFGEKSAKELANAIKKLRGEKASQLILDLRGNPGGIVTEAVAMAAAFLPNETLVFKTAGRHVSVNKDYRTGSGGDFRDMPMVVLIDQGSASASEALAMSFQDHDRAVIAGRRSFGKALMQTGFLVQNGYVTLTVGHIVGPSGRYIQRPYSGLKLEQYYAFAGDSAWQDTTRTFKTDNGRVVKGGGGVAPDVALPGRPAAPRWFTVAVDSGWDRAVADSVAFTLGSDAAARTAWKAAGTVAWAERLVPPLMARVRSRLRITAEVDSTLGNAIARRLAARAATVRWGDEAGDELRVSADPDIIAALALFSRLDAILGTKPSGGSVRQH